MHRILAAFGVVLVGIAIASLIAVYGYTISLTIDGYEEAESEHVQLQCLRDIILTEVPADAVVFVANWSGSEQGRWEVDAYWSERITELTYPERSVTDDASRADIVVRLVQDDGRSCDGFGIEVTQP